MFANKVVKETDREVVSGAETIIGASVKVEGDFICEGSMVVDGEVKGNIKTSSLITVGASAKITADVEAKDAKIAGQIIGNLKINHCLELVSTAVIKGDINCAKLIIAEGAIVNGLCQMSTRPAIANESLS